MPRRGSIRLVGRIALNVLTALSLLLAIGVAALAPHSYKANSIAVWRIVSYADGATDWRYTQVTFGRGWIGFASIRRIVRQNWFDLPDLTRNRQMFDAIFAEELNGKPYASVPGYAAWQGWKYNWGNFQVARLDYKPPEIYRGYSITVPWWLVAGILVSVPSFRLARWAKRWRRLRRGLCVTCGYDLRATPGRCPECGTPAEPPHNPPMQRTGRGMV